MKKINKIIIDKSPMKATQTTKQYNVEGEPGAMFGLRVVNKSSGHFYNFPENTDSNFATPPAPAFTATTVELNTKTIDDSGVYSSFISFPAITGNDGYKLVLLPKGNTELNTNFSFEKNYESPDFIKQYSDTAITFSLLHSNAAVVEPSNVVSTGTNHFISTGAKNSFSINWDLTLSSSQCVIARQPNSSDFEFTFNRVTRRTKTTSLDKFELTDVSGLSVGMGVSGTGVDSGVTIASIKTGYYDETNSTVQNPVYIIPTVLETDENNKLLAVSDKGGTITLSTNAASQVANRSITFTGKGALHVKKYNNTEFKVSNFALTIDSIRTTTDAAVSNSTTIPITSTNGIKAADTVLMSGIGVTTTAPHVDTVNNGVSVVVSTNQTIENGQTVTFTGSSRSANIKLDVEVLNHGKSPLTLKLNLDNILTVG
tara:strand:+ start:465 stop:1748 length:1284 start_codon:yes stop_codon:yes gene_type:complete